MLEEMYSIFLNGELVHVTDSKYEMQTWVICAVANGHHVKILNEELEEIPIPTEIEVPKPI